MAQKILKEKSIEKCKKCNQPLVENRHRGRYCECWEDVIPYASPLNEAKILAIGGSIENYEKGLEYENTPLTPEEVEGKLVEAGLSPHEVELVMMRVVEQKQMKDVVSEGGWTSESSARHHLKGALKRLRKAGFKI